MENKSIQDRLFVFIEYLGISEREFARKTDLQSSHMTAIKGGTNFRIDILLKILSGYPDLNSEWLITGNGSMLKKYVLPEKEPNYVSESVNPYNNSSIMTVDKAGNMMIPVADIKAAAGDGYMNSEVLQTSDFVQLPSNLIKQGKYFLCVRIKGASMSPTLQDGGYVVIRLLDKSEWANLISDRVYVVSDMEGMTYLKRVRNRFNNGFIVLTSDSPEKSTYPNFNLFENEISTIWYVEWYLSAKLPNIHDGFYSKLERLENNIDDINRKFEDLERKIKKI